MKLGQRLRNSGCCFAVILVFSLAEGADTGSLQFSGVHFRQPVGIDPYLGLGNKVSSPLAGLNSLARSAPRPPPPSIQTQTIASPLGLDRSRRTVGIFERVIISAKGYHCHWQIITRPNSALTVTEPVNPVKPGMGTRVVLNAGFGAHEVTVYATVVGGEHTGKEFDVRFMVVEPTHETATAGKPYYHTKGKASAGFTAKNITLHPKSVSFYAVQLREGTCRATASGIFRNFNGLRHPLGNWYGFNENNISNFDDSTFIRSSLSPNENPLIGWKGDFAWPVPRHFRGYRGKLDETDQRQGGVDGLPLPWVDTSKTVTFLGGLTILSRFGTNISFSVYDPNEAGVFDGNGIWD